MFPSGRWKGFWECGGLGRRWMEPLTLRFAHRRVDGEGEDCVGRFTFAGSYTDSGVLSLVKQYEGRHAVRYEGRAEGEGAVVGQWSIGPAWFGPFALMPVIDDVSQLPIFAFAASEGVAGG
jgi:hypothetical protein